MGWRGGGGGGGGEGESVLPKTLHGKIESHKVIGIFCEDTKRD